MMVLSWQKNCGRRGDGSNVGLVRVKEKPPRWRRAVRQCLGFLAKADKVSVVLGYFAHDIGEIGLD
jgi:hypothetical protein